MISGRAHQCFLGPDRTLTQKFTLSEIVDHLFTLREAGAAGHLDEPDVVHGPLDEHAPLGRGLRPDPAVAACNRKYVFDADFGGGRT